MLIGRSGGKQIVGLYGDGVVRLDGGANDAIDVVNAKNSKTVIVTASQDLGAYRSTVRDCQGKVTKSDQVRLAAGPREFTVPVSGILSLVRVK